MASPQRKKPFFLRRAERGVVDQEGPPFCLETAARALGGSTVVYLQPGMRGLTEDQYDELISMSTLPLPDSTEDIAEGSIEQLELKELYNRDEKQTVRCLCQSLKGRYDSNNEYIPGTVRVFFRGTDNFGNVLSDGRIVRVPHPPKRGTPLVDQPTVHIGFLKAWTGNKLKEQVIDFVLKHAERLQSDAEEAAGGDKEKSDSIIVDIAGHSLGGAVSVLAAYDLAVALRDIEKGSSKSKIRLYTFGCPRVGNAFFVQDFNRVVPHCWNVINSNDVVPAVPAATPMVKNTWKRHGRTVIVEEDGTMTVDPSLEVKRARERRVLKLGSCAVSHETGSYRKSLRAVLEKEGLLDPDDPANAKMIAIDTRLEKLGEVITESRADPSRSIHVLPGAT